MNKEFKSILLKILGNLVLWTGIFVLALIKAGIYVVG